MNVYLGVERKRLVLIKKMKLKIIVTLLFFALVSCNFSQKKIDPGEETMLESEGLSVKQASDSVAAEEHALSVRLDSVKASRTSYTTSSGLVILTSNSFQEKVLESDKPVLVMFTAEWSKPCRLMFPLVEEICSEYKGKVVVAKFYMTEDDRVVFHYGVRNIPTFLFFKNGKVVDKLVGAVPKTVICKKLDTQLS